jgi:hypothetical protein
MNLFRVLTSHSLSKTPDMDNLMKNLRIPCQKHQSSIALNEEESESRLLKAR